MTPATGATPSAQDEVAEIARDLIRIDSTNYGDGSGPGERAAAEYVAGKLSEVGLEPAVLESEPGRTSVVVRWEGEDSSRPGLVVHGHLDVVPAQAEDWTHDPFGGEIADGCLWGRGAIDMKDMDAMVLALVRQWRREGRRPPRDVILAFLADEEAGGLKGAHWLVDHHAHLFEGATEAVSEVGGYSFSLDGDRRLYLLETAQKGIQWLRLVAKGRAGHGSMVADDNAIVTLAEAVSRIGRHDWPVRLTPTVTRFLEEMSEALGIEWDGSNPQPVLDKIGSLARIVGNTLRNSANPTMLDAGYKHNVVPQTATAMVDCRFLPGFEDELLETIDELIGPDVRRETVIRDIASGDDDGRRPGRRDGGCVACRGPRCARHPVLALRWHRQQVVLAARHARFRVRASAPAAGPRLPGVVPRCRRAGTAGLPALRRAGARTLPQDLLTGVRRVVRPQAVRTTRITRRRRTTRRLPSA